MDNFFLQVQKDISQLTQNLSILTPKKLSIKLSEVLVGYLGFRKNQSRIQGSKRHLIPDPQYLLEISFVEEGCNGVVVWFTKGNMVVTHL
jgi:hypothetical protein